jgi:AraC family transcriptional regulator
LHNDEVRRSLLSELNRALERPEQKSSLHLSRAQTTRLFKQITGEAPATFRKRLALERAAWCISSTETSITDLALNAGFSSLEGFSRAFKTAFGISPIHFRRVGTGAFQLPSPNNVHFLPKGGNMDVLELMLEHDHWLTKQMLKAASKLTDAQLDSSLAPHKPLHFEAPQTSLRQMFHRLIFWKEVWLFAIHGFEFPVDQSLTLESLETRLERAAPAFLALAKGVRDAGNWQGAFVDHLCEPPETFTFGGVLAHVLTFSAHQRFVMLEVLRGFGIHDLGSGDPIEYVQRKLEAM